MKQTNFSERQIKIMEAATLRIDRAWNTGINY